MYPNLYCPGAVKSGTTTLYKILLQHPEIFFSHKKELHYFDFNKYRGLDWYEKQFSKAAGQKYLCDFTPSYMIIEDFPAKAMEISGSDTKFIFMLRNPVDRIHSQYLMLKGLLKEPEESIKKMVEDLELGCSHTKHKLLNLGFYYEHISNFLKIFPKENLHFIIFEDFVDDIEGACLKLLKFLGLETNTAINYNIWENHARIPKSLHKVRLFKIIDKIIPSFIRNRIPGGTKAKVRENLKSLLIQSDKVKVQKDPELCSRLIKIYEKDINDLEKLLDRELSCWKQKYSKVI